MKEDLQSELKLNTIKLTYELEPKIKSSSSSSLISEMDLALIEFKVRTAFDGI